MFSNKIKKIQFSPTLPVEEEVDLSEEEDLEESEYLDEMESTLTLDPPIQVLITGPTKSGKTNALKAIFKDNASKFDYGFVFCSTAELNHDYDWLPRKYRQNFSEELLHKILKLQATYVKQKKDVKCFIILDDILGVVKTHQSDLFDKLASSSRHYNISVFYLVQMVKGVSPCVRDNCSIVLATEVNKRDSDELFGLAHRFESKTAFWNVLVQHARDYQFVCFKRRDNVDYRVIKFPHISSNFKLQYK